MKKNMLLIILILIFIFNYADNLLENPQITDNGQYFLFEFNDDVYSVDINGGQAVQLTVHPAYDGDPVISSDNRYIAFSSDRSNSRRKIFIMDLEENKIKQLTFARGYDYPLFFENDKLIFQSTNRELGTFIYSVNIDGGIPEKYFYAPARFMDKENDIIVYMSGKVSSYRYKYHGSADYEIYMKKFDSKEPVTQLTNNDYQDIFPKLRGEQLYYISPYEGIYNIMRKNMETGKTEVITNSKSNINRFSIDKSGKLIVFEQNYNIYSLDIEKNIIKDIKVGILPDRIQSQMREETINKVKDFSVSLNNDSLMLINSYGEIFLYYPEILDDNLTKNPAWDKSPIFIDSTNYYFISNRDGYYNVYKGDKEGNIKQITNSELPNDIFAVSDEDNGSYDKTLIFRSPEAIYIYEKNRIKKLDKGQIYNAVLSPNNRYIAYTKMNRDGQSYSVDNIYIYDREKKNVNQLTKSGFISIPIMFSSDCSRLYYIYCSNIERMERYRELFYIDLTKPITEYKRFEDEKDSLIEDINIDYNNINKKTHMVLDEKDIVFAIPSPDRNTIVIVVNKENKHKVYKINVKEDRGTIDFKKEFIFETEKINEIKFSPSGNQLFYISGDKLFSSSLSGNPIPILFRSVISKNSEERFNELFKEAWLILNDYFYDADFHQNDWNNIKEKYEKYVENAENFNKLGSIVYRMFGDLNASHLFFGEERQKTLEYGDLGIRYIMDSHYPKITEIFEMSALNKKNIEIRKGDYIISIDDNDLKNTDPAKYLLNKSGKKVKIIVRRTLRSKDIEHIIIPSSQGYVYTLMYDEWVKRREFITDSLSNGKLGYIHIQAMGNRDYWKFLDKILYELTNKEGLIIDVRNNGGGFSYDYYITFFQRQMHLFKYSRYSEKQTTPLLRWNKPVIMLINEGSFSNAEMFPYVFKKTGIGKVIGMPTAGSVIGTYGTTLFDGTMFRIPALGVFRQDGTNLENNPTEPDIFVENPPEDYLHNSDTQLKRAVEELLK